MEQWLKRDIKVQTRQVLTNLRTLLEDAGSGMESVIKISYLFRKYWWLWYC